MAGSAACGGAPVALRPRAHEPRRKRLLLALTSVALATLLLPALHRPQLRLVWNASASLPIGLYRIEPGDHVRVGDLALVRPSPGIEALMAERRYVERDVPLLKPVAAVAGATVCRTGLRVTIAGRTTVSALPRDRIHRPLPGWSGCRRLAADELFLITPASPASFDSRYFGPVTRAQIIGRALPLWTWP